MGLFEKVYEIVEKEFCIDRTAARFGVELRRKPRMNGMSHTFVGTVVHIYEIRFPAFRQRIGFDCITVVCEVMKQRFVPTMRTG